MNEMDKNYLNECFRYSDGHLFWRERPERHFKNSSIAKGWNKRFSGKQAENKSLKFGGYTYHNIQVFGKTMRVHRVIWCMHYGDTDAMIDHIDGDTTNNKIENLRAVNNVKNLRNRSINPKNKTGVSGVQFVASRDRYSVYIGAGGKRKKMIGWTRDFFEACCIRKSAESKLGYEVRPARLRFSL